MAYLVVPGSFAMKCSRFVTGEEPQNAHSISYCRCNFDCEFCFFKYYQPTNRYEEFTAETFEAMVRRLLPEGQVFKFTGGEPALNPDLRRDLKIVKRLGGITFLDTNGSMPERILPLMEEGLVDLFGISLKGLSAEEAVRRSGGRPGKICWDNVLFSIGQIAVHPSCDVIVTYVCYDAFRAETLEAFGEILSRYPKVYLKINNYQPNREHPTPGLSPKDPAELVKILMTFVDKNPQWKGRVTLVPGPQAVEQFSKVIML